MGQVVMGRVVHGTSCLGASGPGTVTLVRWLGEFRRKENVLDDCAVMFTWQSDKCGGFDCSYKRFSI
jgi:hypothetical protein